MFWPFKRKQVAPAGEIFPTGPVDNEAVARSELAIGQLRKRPSGLAVRVRASDYPVEPRPQYVEPYTPLRARSDETRLRVSYQDDSANTALLGAIVLMEALDCSIDSTTSSDSSFDSGGGDFGGGGASGDF